MPVLLGCPLFAAGLEVPVLPSLAVAGGDAGVAILVDGAGGAGVPLWPLLVEVLVLPFWPTVELVRWVPHPAVIAAAINSTVRKAYEARQTGVIPLKSSSKLCTALPIRPLRSSLRVADCVKVVGAPCRVAGALTRGAAATLRTASPADRATDTRFGSWVNAFEQGPGRFVNKSIGGSD